MYFIYDYCIIGGGIAGLYCAIELLKKKKQSILLCEKYATLGGKVSTFHGTVKSVGKIQYEEGAGRISKEHRLVLELVKRYKLTLYPIQSEIHYKKDGSSPITENYFEPTLDVFISPLKNLPKEELQNHTIRELLTKIHGKEETDSYLNRFPYRSEVDVLRADVGLESFAHEMKTHEGYFVLGEGLSALIEKMRREFLSLGGKIVTHLECIDIAHNEDFTTSFFSGPPKLMDKRKRVSIHSKKLICAIPSEALKKIPYFKNLNVLKHVKMEPLLRTYAAYKTPWFKGLGRIVTDTPIRYFLPINNNVAMVSYTDSRDAEYYKKIDKKRLGNLIQKELRELFPDRTIPDYSFFKDHYWSYGATYWLPGDYTVSEESMNSIKPFDEDLFIVGESFSMKQAWMEGALEQSKKYLDNYI